MKSAPFATKPLKVLPASPYLLLRARVYQPGDDENIRLGIKHQEMMEVSCGHGQFQRYQAPSHKCYVCCLALMEGKNRMMFEGKYANAMVVSELMNEDIYLLNNVTKFNFFVS